MALTMRINGENRSDNKSIQALLAQLVDALLFECIFLL